MGITIPSTVKVIGESAFRNCTRLRNVKLCDGLESIHRGAFKGCTSLERIGIPSSVCFIHKNAFRDCRVLVAVKFCQEIEDLLPSCRCGKGGIVEFQSSLY